MFTYFHVSNSMAMTASLMKVRTRPPRIKEREYQVQPSFLYGITKGLWIQNAPGYYVNGKVRGCPPNDDIISIITYYTISVNSVDMPYDFGRYLVEELLNERKKWTIRRMSFFYVGYNSHVMSELRYKLREMKRCYVKVGDELQCERFLQVSPRNKSFSEVKITVMWDVLRLKPVEGLPGLQAIKVYEMKVILRLKGHFGVLRRLLRYYHYEIEISSKEFKPKYDRTIRSLLMRRYSNKL